MKYVRILTDLGFGDSGKGTISDYFTSIYPNDTIIVKTNGGPQASHNVVTPEGLHYPFAIFGGGSFHFGIKTYLSEYMLVNPFKVDDEISNLNKIIKYGNFNNRLIINENCLVITPFHIFIGREKESIQHHGSTGEGIGETVEYNINTQNGLRIKDLQYFSDTYNKIKDYIEYVFNYMAINNKCFIYSETEDLFNDPEFIFNLAVYYTKWYRKQYIVKNNYINNIVNDYQQIIFESEQGTLLDEDFGFHPHTTWSKTTNKNALKLLENAIYNKDEDIKINKYGIMRAYTTRHGNGPLPTEDNILKNIIEKEHHNSTTKYAGEFRYGWLDIPLMRYAISCNYSIDEIILTNLDRIEKINEWKVCVEYDNFNNEISKNIYDVKPIYETQNDTWDLIKLILRELDLPIGIISKGPTYQEKMVLI
jgi:adenylosuccinate synthase